MLSPTSKFVALSREEEKFIWDIMSSGDKLQNYSLLSVCTRWLNPMILFIALTTSYVGNLPISSNFFVKNVGRLWDYTTKRSPLGQGEARFQSRSPDLQTCVLFTALTYRFPQNLPSHMETKISFHTTSLSVAASVTFFRKCHAKDKVSWNFK